MITRRKLFKGMFGAAGATGALLLAKSSVAEAPAPKREGLATKVSSIPASLHLERLMNDTAREAATMIKRNVGRRVVFWRMSDPEGLNVVGDVARTPVGPVTIKHHFESSIVIPLSQLFVSEVRQRYLLPMSIAIAEALTTRGDNWVFGNLPMPLPDTGAVAGRYNDGFFSMRAILSYAPPDTLQQVVNLDCLCGAA